MLKTAASTPAVGITRRGFDIPDLHAQFEDLLHQVWRSEAEWRLYDRIDAFCAAEPDHCGARPTSAHIRARRSKQ